MIFTSKYPFLYTYALNHEKYYLIGAHHHCSRCFVLELLDPIAIISHMCSLYKARQDVYVAGYGPHVQQMVRWLSQQRQVLPEVIWNVIITVNALYATVVTGASASGETKLANIGHSL